METGAKSKLIRHKGVVKKISSEKLIVAISSESACVSCHAKGMCAVSDVAEKEIEIKEFSEQYNVGDEVMILFRETLGFKALFFGYILPLIFLVSALAVFTELFDNEGLSGLLALAVLIPYYITLYFFRNDLKKILKFQLEEI